MEKITHSELKIVDSKKDLTRNIKYATNPTSYRSHHSVDSDGQGEASPKRFGYYQLSNDIKVSPIRGSLLMEL